MLQVNHFCASFFNTSKPNQSTCNVLQKKNMNVKCFTSFNVITALKESAAIEKNQILFQTEHETGLKQFLSTRRSFQILVRLTSGCCLEAIITHFKF